MTQKKHIAIITRGLKSSSDQQDSLEQELRRLGMQVDLFDVDKVKAQSVHLANKYDIVLRSVPGGREGATAESLILQDRIVKQGAEPYISEKKARTITDRILCKDALAQRDVPSVPMVAIAADGFSNSEKEAIAQLSFPCVVQKNIGSGRDSFRLARDMNGVAEAAQALGKSGKRLVVHQLPPLLDQDTIAQYGITADKDGEAVSAEQRRSHQFRVVLVDNKPFSAYLVFSKPDSFGLSEAQGATPLPLPLEKTPPQLLQLAQNAARATGNTNLSAVDLIPGNEPQVLGINVSPNLQLKNERGEKLMHAVAHSIGRIAGVLPPQPGIYVDETTRQTGKHSSTRSSAPGSQ